MPALAAALLLATTSGAASQSSERTGAEASLRRSAPAEFWVWEIARSKFEAAFTTAFGAVHEGVERDPLLGGVAAVSEVYDTSQFTAASDAYEAAENQLRVAAPEGWDAFAMADADWHDVQTLAVLEVAVRRAAPAEYAIRVVALAANAAAEADLRETAPAEWTAFRAAQAERHMQETRWRILREAAESRLRDAAPVEWAVARAALEAVRKGNAGADAAFRAAQDRLRKAAPAEWEEAREGPLSPPIDRRAATIVGALREAAPTAMARRSAANALIHQAEIRIRRAAPTEWAAFEAAVAAWPPAAVR